MTLSDVLSERSYRSALLKHMSLISSCAEFDPIHSAMLLHANCHLTTPVLKVLEVVNANAGSEACASTMTTTIVSLSDSALHYFVVEMLPEMGLEKISRSIQQCPGNADCSLRSHQYHDNVSNFNTYDIRGPQSAKTALRENFSEFFFFGSKLLYVKCRMPSAKKILYKMCISTQELPSLDGYYIVNIMQNDIFG